MKVRPTLIALTLAVAGLGLPGQAMAGPCRPVVTDPPADTKYFLVNVDAGAYDIQSADIKVDGTWTTVAMRFKDFAAQDAWTQAFGKQFVFFWRPQKQKPGTKWYGLRVKFPVRPELGAPVFEYGTSSSRQSEDISTEIAANRRTANGVVDASKSEVRIWAKTADLMRLPGAGSLKSNVKQGEFKVIAHALRPDGTIQTPLDWTDNTSTRGSYVAGKPACIASAR